MCSKRNTDAGFQSADDQILSAVRSIFLQGARIERHNRSVEWARLRGDGSSAECGCGCGDAAADKTGGSTGTEDAETRAAILEERRERASRLRSGAQLARRALRKGIASARVVVNAAEGDGLLADANRWKQAADGFAKSPRAVADLLKLAGRYGFNVDIVAYLIDELAKLDRPPALSNDLKALKRVQAAANDSVGMRSEALTGDDVADAIDDSAIGVTFVDGDPVVTVRCDRLPPGADVACSIIALGVIAVAGAILLGNAIHDLFNSTADDNARAFIRGRSCGELGRLSIGDRLRLIRVMLDGPTGDDDENAIARLLECSTCEDVRTLVREVGLTRLLDHFHGSEWDRLMLRLQRCGLVSFADWDDDATRKFIRDSDCATLNALTLPELRRLVLNLFEGDTGDADENAIVKLIRCLPCERRRELMRLSGVRFGDFDNEVHGSEWDRLEPLLRCR